MGRAMKVQEVILRAISKQIRWFEAAKILGLSGRQLRRLYYRYRTYGYDGLYDRRKGKPSPRRVPLAVAEKIFALHREKYFDFSVRHFHEKLWSEHHLLVSYSWVKQALQGAGLVAKERQRGVHRRKRERRPMVGMMLHIDGSRHEWLGEGQWHDLLVVLDDATSDLLRAVGGGGIDGYGAGGVARGGGAARDFLFAVQRSRQPLLVDAEERRARGPATDDASGAGAAGSGYRDDPGVFAASAWAERTELRDVAAASAAGVARERDNEERRSQPISAGEL
jgi:transposase